MIVDGLLTLSFEDGLMILNHETGSEIGFVPYLRRMMPTGPASADEEAIFVNIWNIYRISKNNFAIEWTYKTNKTYMDGFAIISGNYLYVANHLGMVLALNKRTGEPVWSFQTEGGGYILLCMAVADDKLFVGNSMGYFYCFVEDR